MTNPASTKTTQPKYQRILDHLNVEILSGRLGPGTALPTEAELCRNLQMSRGTVRQALAELEGDGMIERIQGKGTFVKTEQQRQSTRQLATFALIAPQLREGFYPSLVHGFEQASSGFQHQVVVSNSGNDTGRQADLVLQMIDRAVGGVALVPTTKSLTPGYQVKQLQKSHIPVVFCHRSVEGVSAPCVTWSGYDVGFQAGTALLKQGHCRVGFAFANLTSMGAEYERGLRSALRIGSLSEPELFEIDYGSGLEAGQLRSAIRSAVEKIIAMPNRPTAIFCGNIGHAEQIYLQAEELGLKVPHDLSLISFGGMWRGHGLAERISCVAVDEHQLGARAAELLHEMRSGKRPIESNERIEFQVSMLPGETIASVPQG